MDSVGFGINAGTARRWEVGGTESTHEKQWACVHKFNRHANDLNMGTRRLARLEGKRIIDVLVRITIWFQGRENAVWVLAGNALNTRGQRSKRNKYVHVVFGKLEQGTHGKLEKAVTPYRISRVSIEKQLGSSGAAWLRLQCTSC